MGIEVFKKRFTHLEFRTKCTSPFDWDKISQRGASLVTADNVLRVTNRMLTDKGLVGGRLAGRVKTTTQLFVKRGGFSESNGSAVAQISPAIIAVPSADLSANLQLDR